MGENLANVLNSLEDDVDEDASTGGIMEDTSVWADPEQAVITKVKR
jgi:hypothetical protein